MINIVCVKQFVDKLEEKKKKTIKINIMVRKKMKLQISFWQSYLPPI